MNWEQFKKNVGLRFQLRPPAFCVNEGATSSSSPDDDWVVLEVSETFFELSNCRTKHKIRLGKDHIHHFTSNPNRSDSGTGYGFLTLNVQVYIQGKSIWLQPNSGPGQAGLLPRLPLSPLENWLARKFHSYNFSEPVKPIVMLGVFVIVAVMIFGVFQMITAKMVPAKVVQELSGQPGTSSPASVELGKVKMEVLRIDSSGEAWNAAYFPVEVYNATPDALRVLYWKVTDLSRLENDVFVPWGEIDALMLGWPGTVPKVIAASDKISIPFARILPADLQKRLGEGKLYSGDPNIPQLRFIASGAWSRRMTSHIPPGTYRFRLAVFFERKSPAEALIELKWSGEHQQDVSQMSKEIRFEKIDSNVNS